MQLPLAGGCTLPVVDAECAREWMGVVHRVARDAGWRVSGTALPPTVGQNYYAVDCEGLLQLRLNVPLRLVGAVYDADSRLNAEFRDVPGPDAFGEAGFAVASVTQLEGGFTDSDLAQLTEPERKDIAHHRVWRLGDVVFNWFD
ncbi:hypothetical protein ACIA49_14025 [Kribbella sp. NPDC051587]|uniref:hypothetical protein n=1 Tax=Kribbella sp. NPDC051587 TaxID=3364119 RepID=UPI0037A034A6